MNNKTKFKIILARGSRIEFENVSKKTIISITSESILKNKLFVEGNEVYLRDIKQYIPFNSCFKTT